MWYHTKELYMASQIRCYLPKAMPEAAEFSEELYQQVFEAVVADRVAFFTRAVQYGLEKGFDMPPCDEMEQRQIVESMVCARLKDMEMVIPENILSRVADRRMLALNAATPEVCALIQARKKEITEEWNIRNEEYCAWLAWLEDRHPDSFLNDLHFHDAQISKLKWDGENLKIEFNPNCHGCRTPVSKILFEKCRILHMDEGLEGAYWLYEEVYETDYGFEMHIMAEYEVEGIEIAELVLRAKNVRYEYNKRT